MHEHHGTLVDAPRPGLGAPGPGGVGRIPEELLIALGGLEIELLEALEAVEPVLAEGRRVGIGGGESAELGHGLVDGEVQLAAFVGQEGDGEGGAAPVGPVGGADLHAPLQRTEAQLPVGPVGELGAPVGQGADAVAGPGGVEAGGGLVGGRLQAEAQAALAQDAHVFVVGEDQLHLALGHGEADGAGVPPVGVGHLPLPGQNMQGEEEGVGVHPGAGLVAGELEQVAVVVFDQEERAALPGVDGMGQVEFFTASEHPNQLLSSSASSRAQRRGS